MSPNPRGGEPPVVPRRWHVYVVDLEPQVGSKPGKKRPCLAVQPTEFAEAGHPSTVMLPLSSRLAGADAYPLRVRIPAGAAGLDVASDILIDQMLAWDNRLFRKELGVLPESLQEQVRAAMREFLEL